MWSDWLRTRRFPTVTFCSSSLANFLSIDFKTHPATNPMFIWEGILGGRSAIAWISLVAILCRGLNCLEHYLPYKPYWRGSQAVKVYIMVLRVMTPCSLVVGDQRLRGTCPFTGHTFPLKHWYICTRLNGVNTQEKMWKWILVGCKKVGNWSTSG